MIFLINCLSFVYFILRFCIFLTIPVLAISMCGRNRVSFPYCYSTSYIHYYFQTRRFLGNRKKNTKLGTVNQITSSSDYKVVEVPQKEVSSKNSSESVPDKTYSSTKSEKISSVETESAPTPKIGDFGDLGKFNQVYPSSLEGVSSAVSTETIPEDTQRSSPVLPDHFVFNKEDREKVLEVWVPVDFNYFYRVFGNKWMNWARIWTPCSFPCLVIMTKFM